jgi:hypothetical protein
VTRAIGRAHNNALPAIRALFRDLGFDVNHSWLLGLVQHSFMRTPRMPAIWLLGWLFTTSSSWWKASAAARQAGRGLRHSGDVDLLSV